MGYTKGIPVCDIIELHKQVLYPTIRVRSEHSGGSGTVVHSAVHNGSVITAVMTNHHVVEDCIEVKKKWDPMHGENRDHEVKKTVYVEYFNYNNYSKCIGSFSVEADIVAYDADQDLALLITRDKENIVPNVANVFPVDRVSEIHIFDPVFSVGASLGHPPIPTDGRICFLDDEIDNYKYMLITASSLYGSSGGGIYRWSIERERYEYMGIPSRITAIPAGFMAVDTITHMGYAICIDRIIQFIDKHCYQFIYNPAYTVEQCDKMRDDIKKDDKRRKRNE